MKKLLAILLIAMMLVFTLASCDFFELPPETTTTTTTTGATTQPEPDPAPAHECEHACEECGKCLDSECTEAACADKCEGHVPPHVCEHACEECGKCLDLECAECTDKCEGHHEHSYEAEVTAPTCENGGYTTYTCACGHTYTDDETAALGHDKVTQEAVGATCTATGLTAGEYCTRCDYKVEQEEVAALGHSYNKEVTAPSCKNGGYTTYTCSVCSDSYVADQTAALGHSYNAEVTAPSCLNGGYTTYTCSVCSDSYVADQTAALGHSYNAEVTAPTCFAAGFTTHTCHCGDSYVDSETAQLIHIDANDDEMCDHGCGTEMLKPRYTVTLKYGSHTKTLEVKEGTKLTEADLALDSKYPFALVEWQKDGVAYDLDATVTGEMTLTAVLESYKLFESPEAWKNSGSTTNTEIADETNPENTILQFTTVGNYSGIYSQNLHFHEDFTDVRYIYLKVRVSVDTKINLRFFKENNAFASTYMQAGENVSADGKWHIVCVDLDSLTTFSKEEIKLMLIMSNVAATVEIDDIYFAREEIEIELPEEEKPDDGIVVKYDFESGADKWVTTGSTTTVELIQTGALSGTQSLKVSTGANYAGVMNYSLSDVDMTNVNYIYITIKSNTAIGNLQLRIYADAEINDNRTNGITATTVFEGSDYKIIRFDISNWEGIGFKTQQFTKDDISNIALIGAYKGTIITIDDIIFASQELTFE